MEQPVIICVDDERSVLNGLQAQLHREFGREFVVEIAQSGEESLELIEELIQAGLDLPIIISDQLMPVMKGDELLARVHKLLPGTLKVLLTGQSDIKAISNAVNNANLYRYIEKPWEGQDLFLTVKEAIRVYYTDRELEEKNKLLERHNLKLEELVKERTGALIEEKEKSDNLLLNILPKEIALELKNTGKAKTRHYEKVTVLFTDFSAFTERAEKTAPQELVETLNDCFSAFDDIIEAHGLEKIKTIGDAYMCAGGLPQENKSNPIDAAKAAIEIRDWINKWNAERSQKALDLWEIRIGIHTGELVAGVIGKRKFAYDVWGDGVNIAARMESSSEPGMIQISSETHSHLVDVFDGTYRGKIDIKGKGEMETYYLNKLNI